jgi:hypothetical protein
MVFLVDAIRLGSREVRGLGQTIGLARDQRAFTDVGDLCAPANLGQRQQDFC